jgi:YHS domain-containing protein
VGALLWIARALVLLLILRFVLRLLFGARGPLARGPAPRGRDPLERAGGELVRDPHCGTYVPKSRAVVSGSGASAQYFCSTRCRDAFARQA